MSELSLKGTILGFEEYTDFTLRNAFVNNSSFRLLECPNGGFSFVVVNPYDVTDNYTFDIEDETLAALNVSPQSLENLAVLCIVRHTDEGLFVNLRSPLVFNTERRIFRQVILGNDAYPVSALITRHQQ
jgi:flagellar assembly factor FliW